MRDVLRFSEILPDIDFCERVKFKTFVDFPLSEDDEDEVDILTKLDFQSEEKLKQKLGLVLNFESTEEANFLKTIVGRYVGLHSTIPLKNTAGSFQTEEEIQKCFVQKIEKSIQHSHIASTEETQDKGLRKKLNESKVSENILSAIRNKNYRYGKFKEQYEFPENFDFEEAKKDSIYPFKRKGSNNPIIVGKENIKVLLQHHDNKIGKQGPHQGLSDIVKMLRKDKIEILFNKDDNSKPQVFTVLPESSFEESLQEYFDCKQCEVVETIKRKGVHEKDIWNLTEEEDAIQDAIVFGDRNHNG